MKRSVFFIMVFLSHQLWSQQDTTELMPVEIKAIRASATAPFAKTNINKTTIQKQNLGQDLPFLLNQTPSVVVSSDAGNGIGYTGIRIRGTDASRINVTLNGVPFNDPESGGTFFVDLPDFLSSVNSIQIQRGVGTSTNGAGAFGGTINLSTNEMNRVPYAEFNNSFGSFSTLKNTIKVGSGLLNDHFTADLRVSKIVSDGYIDRSSSDLKSFYFSTAYNSKKTDLRLNIFSGKEKTYQAWYGVSETDLETNRTINYAGTEKMGDPYDNETDNYKQDHYQVFFNQKLASHLQFSTGLFYIKGKGYYEQYKAGEAYSDYALPVPPSGVTTTDLVRQLWLDNDYYGNIFSVQHESIKSTITLGGAVSKYKGRHFGKVIWAENGLAENTKTWYNVPATKNDFNIYSKWQQKFKSNWQFFVDLQLRTVAHHINGFRYNPTIAVNKKYTFFNPKAGITYQHKELMLFASFSRAAKEPNRDDFEVSPTSQPLPEILNDLEIGIEKKSALVSWNAGFYYMKYKNQLVLTGKINDVGAYSRTNLPNSYRMGIELQAMAKLNSWLSISGNLTLSENKILNFNEYIDDYDNGGQKQNHYVKSDISFSPRVIGSTLIKIEPIKNLSIDLPGKFVGKQFLDNTGNESRKLNPFFTQDARVSYLFQLPKIKNIEAIFQFNNIFNKKYEPNGYTFSYYAGNKLNTENYYFPMAGTNWFLGLNIKL